MKKLKYIIGFTVTVLLMLAYIGTVFYLSEPKYVDNMDENRIQKYDYVSIYRYGLDVKNGIVLQTDSKKALVLVKEFSDTYYEVTIGSNEYRIVGRGTIYHRVNQYVGFNIMMITQFIIIILMIILAFNTNRLFFKLTEDD